MEDEQAGLLKKFLQDVSYVKKIEEEHGAMAAESNGKSVLNCVKKILEGAKGKDLFKDINEPFEWQGELRKEWSRNF